MKLYKYKKGSLNTDDFIIKSVQSYLSSNISPKISKTENGKPYFEDLPIHIGVTHTKDIIIIGLAEKNFGIDCELSSRIIKHHDKISDKYFSEQEKKLPFLKAWTRKEAFAKFLGVRLLDVLYVDTFSIDGVFDFPEDDNLIICIYTQKDAV